MQNQTVTFEDEASDAGVTGPTNAVDCCFADYDNNGWLDHSGTDGNVVEDKTQMFVVGSTSVFCVRENGDDTIFTLSDDSGGSFRIVAGWNGAVYENSQWVKKVDIEIDGGDTLEEDYVLPVWKTVDGTKIYSAVYSFLQEEVDDGEVVEVDDNAGHSDAIAEVAFAIAWNHRPEIYMHSSDYHRLSGPIDIENVLALSTLVIDPQDPEKNINSPDKDDLIDNDEAEYYLELPESLKSKVWEATNAKVYWREVFDSNFSDKLIIQYWFFYSDSYLPWYPTRLGYDGGPCHRCDWEMCQITFEIKLLYIGEGEYWISSSRYPWAMTTSRHYNGETLPWEDDEVPGTPGDTEVDKKDNDDYRPKVFVACNSHATYYKEHNNGMATYKRVKNFPKIISYFPFTVMPEDTMVKFKQVKDFTEESANQNYIHDSSPLEHFSDDSLWWKWKGKWGENGGVVSPGRSDKEQEARMDEYGNLLMKDAIKWHNFWIDFPDNNGDRSWLELP